MEKETYSIRIRSIVLEIMVRISLEVDNLSPYLTQKMLSLAFHNYFRIILYKATQNDLESRLFRRVQVKIMERS